MPLDFSSQGTPVAEKPDFSSQGIASDATPFSADAAKQSVEDVGSRLADLVRGAYNFVSWPVRAATGTVAATAHAIATGQMKDFGDVQGFVTEHYGWKPQGPKDYTVPGPGGKPEQIGLGEVPGWAVGKAFEEGGKVVDLGAEGILAATGSPLAATAAKVGGTAAMFAAAHEAGKGVKAVRDRAESSRIAQARDAMVAAGTIKVTPKGAQAPPTPATEAPAPAPKAPAPESLPTDLAWRMKDFNRATKPNSTDLEALRRSIRKHGIQKPITVTVSEPDGMAYVTDGNNRLAAAKDLGIENVPVKWERSSVAFTDSQKAKAVPLSELGVNLEDIGKPKLTPQQQADQAELRRILGESGTGAPAPATEVAQQRAGVFLGKDMADTVLPDKAVNINFANLETTDQVKGAIAAVADLYRPEIDQARRGTMSFEQTRKLASDLNMRPEDLIKRNAGQALNAEQALAARSMLMQSGQQLIDSAKKAVGGSDEDMAAFQHQMKVHAALEEQVSGMTAEAGRALSQFRIKATSDIAKRRAIRETLDNVGREKVEATAEALATLDSPEGLNKFVRDMQKPKATDKLIEIWINALLSGPQTHVVNSTSNTLVSLWQIPERTVAAGIGLFHGGEKVPLREPLYQTAGWLLGMKDGARVFAQTLKSGEPIDAMTKVEQASHKALKGGVGAAVRVPTRLLTSEDEMFKAIARRSEMNAMAVRRAFNEKAPDIPKRVQEILANPPADMLEAADQHARYVTFNKPLGEAGRAVQRLANTHVALKVIVPFVRTPTNIVKFAGERTPFALASGAVRAEIAKGGAARDIQLARMGLGTAVGAYTAYLARQGLITGGGPSDPNMRRSLRDSGWQPYSLKLNNKYYSYGRLEPLGTLLGVSADMAEIYDYIQTDKEKTHLASLISRSVAQNLTSKTFLRGITDVVNALSDPDRYGEQWLQSFAGTVVPTGVAQYNRVQDPTLRETQTVLDRIKSRIPGYSETLPPRRNAFGEPIVLQGGLGPDILSPVYTSKISQDPVYREIARLKLGVAMPAKNLFGVSLDPKQYDEYVVMQGRLAKSQLEAIMSSSGYQSMPDWAKKDLIKRVIQEARNAARGGMIPVVGKQAILGAQRKRVGQ